MLIVPFAATRPVPPHQYHIVELCRHTTVLSQAHAYITKLGFTSFAYTAMIRAHAQRCHPELTLALFQAMLVDGCFKPSSILFSFALKACSSLHAVEEGLQLHGLILKLGFELDLFISNSLIHLYLRTGFLALGLKVFDRMPDRDVVSWNTVVAGLVRMGFVNKAYEVFHEMPERNLVSWNCMIDGHVKHGELELARDLFKRAPVKNTITWNTMIGGYTSSDMMKEASELFDRMPPGMKDLTTFTVMIDGYSKGSRYAEVMEISRELFSSEIKPNGFALVSALSACSHLAALEQGEWVHGYVDRHRLRVDAVLGTALVDMYAKSGRIDKALAVFDVLADRDVGAWNSVISNLGIHGKSEEALRFFAEMLELNVEPDEITFLSVLSACRHSGLVPEGRRFFLMMSERYDIEPKMEHYGCMVDLFCRGGLLDEAKEFIDANAGNCGVAAWGALLGAAIRLGDAETAESAAKHLLELDPDDTRCRILLSNLYSTRRKWNDAVHVRMQMSSDGMVKVPGISSIEVDGVVHEFTVASGLDSLGELV